MKKKIKHVDGKVEFPSGAQSGHLAVRYDLIPGSFPRRVGARFGVGAPKYGDLTYRKGLRDKAYILDRLNHLQAHVLAFLAPQNEVELLDDNLGAIGWAAALLCEVDADPEGGRILEEIRRERGRVACVGTVR